MQVDEPLGAQPIVNKMIKETTTATDDKVRTFKLIMNMEAVADSSTKLSSAAPGATSGGPPIASCTIKSEEYPEATCTKKLEVDVAGNNHPAPQQETFFRDFYDAIQSEIYDFSIDADEADADEARDDWMDTFAGSMNPSLSYLGAVDVVTRPPPCNLNSNLVMSTTTTATAEENGARDNIWSTDTCRCSSVYAFCEAQIKGI